MVENLVNDDRMEQMRDNAKRQQRLELNRLLRALEAQTVGMSRKARDRHLSKSNYSALADRHVRI